MTCSPFCELAVSHHTRAKASLLSEQTRRACGTDVCNFRSPSSLALGTSINAGTPQVTR